MQNRSIIALNSYIAIFAVVWTVVVGASLYWNLNQLKSTALESAMIQARTAFEKDVVYRRWNAMHGGVYAPVTDQTLPNPFLSPEGRDITSTDGLKLTKINPAYMTRQVHELGAIESGIVGHLTSLKPIRPKNAPDPWEKKALNAFENGAPEFSEVRKFNGDSYYMRLMRPLFVEKECMQCHSEQGYTPGEIRGGISVSVPLAPVMAGIRGEQYSLSLTHLVLWLIGLAVLVFFRRSLRNNLLDQQKAETALSESETRYRTTFDSIPDSVTITRVKDGRYFYVNDGFCQITGYSRDEVIGKNPGEINLYWDLEARGKMMDTLKEDGELVNYPMKFRRRDGTPFDSLFSAKPLKIDNEDCLVALAKDISEIKSSEMEKEALKAELRQAQKMEAIGTLAGGIAHDFNNILGAIIGYSELVLMKMGNDNPVSKDQEKVLEAAFRAKELVQQILTFSRREKQERKPLRVGPLINEATKFLMASLPSTIEIKADIEGNQGMILADPTQIHQVMMNLCTNAADSMRETGGVLSIDLKTVEMDDRQAMEYPKIEPGKYMLLSVRDTGMGIDQEIIERIFEPFFTTKEKAKGTGMGLAVVHGIVRGHGGAIKVISEPGKGASFNLVFPCYEGEEAVVDDRPEALPSGSETILLVDDEEMLVDLGSQMLGGLGYDVRARTSPIEALAEFRDNPELFDLVITDMTMPAMTGAALAREIMAIKPGIPVILYTGYSESISEEDARLMGIAKFLYKPLKLEELAVFVRKSLDDSDGTSPTLS